MLHFFGFLFGVDASSTVASATGVDGAALRLPFVPDEAAAAAATTGDDDCLLLDALCLPFAGVAGAGAGAAGGVIGCAGAAAGEADAAGVDAAATERCRTAIFAI